MQKVRITLRGTSPILLHNPRLANPLDEHTKAIKAYTGKRKKTDEDHEKIAELEFLGGLYIDPDLGPYVPSAMVKASIRDGAKLHRLGTHVTQAFYPEALDCQLLYQGPRDAAALVKDPRFFHAAQVKVSQKMVTRVRPQFKDWAVETEALVETSRLSLDDLRMVLPVAGALIGIGDGRTMGYGRYEPTLEVL